MARPNPKQSLLFVALFAAFILGLGYWFMLAVNWLFGAQFLDFVFGGPLTHPKASFILFVVTSSALVFAVVIAQASASPGSGDSDEPG